MTSSSKRHQKLPSGERGRAKSDFGTPISGAERLGALPDVVHVEGPALCVEDHEDERELTVQLNVELPDSGEATPAPSDDSKRPELSKNSKP